MCYQLSLKPGNKRGSQVHKDINSMQWLFRVAAKAESGGGHVSRSLLLAKAMKAKVTFSVSENSSYRTLIESNGFEVITDNEESEQYSGIWLDAYHDNFDRYRSKTKCLAIIEDHRDLYDKADIYVRPYPADFTNRPLSIELKGFDFAFIDSRFFLKRQNSVSSNVKRITVFMGRYDSVNATTSVLEVINDLPKGISVIVVTGSGAAHLDKVKEYLAKDFRHDYQLYIDIPDLCDVFAGSDILVLSGGVALLEACAVGCPAVVLNIADNQHALSEYLSREGAISYAGSYSQFRKSDFTDILRQIFSVEQRQALSNKAKVLIKESGVDDVAAALVKYSMEMSSR